MFVISGLERGGAEAQLVGIAVALSARGWEVTILSFLPFSANSWITELRGTDVRLLTLRATSGLKKYASLIEAARVIKRYRPDILIGFMFHGIMTARVVGRLTSVSINISSIHSERDGTLRERIMGVTDRLTDAVTVMSRHLASDLVHRRVMSNTHVHVIPNLVDVARFNRGASRDQVRAAMGVTKDQFLWLAAGRLDEPKDYPNLLNAFAVLSRRHPDTCLMVAGEGPLSSDLNSMIAHLGMDDCVRLLGLRLDMPKLYAASDALVLSSAWEGMPVVVLEAMASATPVVSTSVGAVPEVVSDGVSGMLVPPGDHQALANGMARMMELPDQTRQALGQAGYRRVRAEFSIDSVIDKWEELFNRLLCDRA